jgi:hypothetical protein
MCSLQASLISFCFFNSCPESSSLPDGSDFIYYLTSEFNSTFIKVEKLLGKFGPDQSLQLTPLQVSSLDVGFVPVLSTQQIIREMISQMLSGQKNQHLKLEMPDLNLKTNC